MEDVVGNDSPNVEIHDDSKKMKDSTPNNKDNLDVHVDGSNKQKLQSSSSSSPTPKEEEVVDVVMKESEDVQPQLGSRSGSMVAADAETESDSDVENNNNNNSSSSQNNNNNGSSAAGKSSQKGKITGHKRKKSKGPKPVVVVVNGNHSNRPSATNASSSSSSAAAAAAMDDGDDKDVTMGGDEEQLEESFAETNDKNNTHCTKCRKLGDLICCDGCPSVYHLPCIPEEHAKPDLENEDAPWYCPKCAVKRAKKEKFLQDRVNRNAEKEKKQQDRQKLFEAKKLVIPTPITASSITKLTSSHFALSSVSSASPKAASASPTTATAAASTATAEEKSNVKLDDADLIVEKGPFAGKKNSDVAPPKPDDHPCFPPFDAFEDVMTLYAFLSEWCSLLGWNSPTLDELGEWLADKTSHQYWEVGYWLLRLCVKEGSSSADFPQLSKQIVLVTVGPIGKTYLETTIENTKLRQMTTEKTWPEVVRLLLLSSEEELAPETRELVDVLSSDGGIIEGSVAQRARLLRIVTEWACESEAMRKMITARMEARSSLSERILAEQMEMARVRKEKEKKKTATPSAAAITNAQGTKKQKQAVVENGGDTTDEDEDDMTRGAKEEENPLATGFDEAHSVAKKKWKEYKEAKEKYKLRITPIGTDRHHRSYWVLPGFVDRVWVMSAPCFITNEQQQQQQQQQPTKHNGDTTANVVAAGSSSSSNDNDNNDDKNNEELIASVKKNMPIYDSSIRPQWVCYQKGSQLEALLRYLDPRGPKESALIEALKRSGIVDGNKAQAATAATAATATARNSGGGGFGRSKNKKITAESSSDSSVKKSNEQEEKKKSKSSGAFSWEKAPSIGEVVWTQYNDSSWHPAKVIEPPEDSEAADRWDAECKKCGKNQDEEVLLVCERYPCAAAYHPSCVGFRKNKVPEGQWTCLQCRYKETEQTDKIFVAYFFDKFKWSEKELKEVLPYQQFKDEHAGGVKKPQLLHQINRAERYIAKNKDNTVGETDALENVEFDEPILSRVAMLLEESNVDTLLGQTKILFSALPVRYLSSNDRKTFTAWWKQTETDGITTEAFVQCLLRLDEMMAMMVPISDSIFDQEEQEDRWEENCRKCGCDNDKEELLCCEGGGCTAAYHPKCTGLDVVPDGDWWCPDCSPNHEDKKPKHSLKRIAAMAVLAQPECIITIPELNAWLDLTFPYAKHRVARNWKQEIAGIIVGDSSLFCNMTVDAKTPGYGHAGMWRFPQDRQWWREAMVQAQNTNAVFFYFHCAMERLFHCMDMVTESTRLKEERWDELCYSCKQGGTLICCTSCPRTVHAACVGLKKVPKGEFTCPLCAEAAKKQKST